MLGASFGVLASACMTHIKDAAASHNTGAGKR